MKGLDQFKPLKGLTEEQQDKIDLIKFTLYLNMAAAQLQLDTPRKAIEVSFISLIHQSRSIL